MKNIDGFTLFIIFLLSLTLAAAIQADIPEEGEAAAAPQTASVEQAETPAPTEEPVTAKEANLEVTFSPSEGAGAEINAAVDAATRSRAEVKVSPKQPEFLFAPVPFENPTLGKGLGGGIGYFFWPDKKDTAIPVSVVGIAGFTSETSSWAAVLGGSLHLKHDKMRVAAGVGTGVFNYDLHGVGKDIVGQGIKVPLEQEGEGVMLRWLFLVAPKTYLGPRIILGKSTIRLGEAWPFAQIPEPEAEADLRSISLCLQQDRRDDSFYPTTGSELKVSAEFWSDEIRIGELERLRADVDYEVYSLAYNSYHSLDPRHVLAFRFYGRTATGRVPFYALSSFGSHSDLRGYTVGRYQDRAMLATQLEYRKRLTEQWGAVVFAGAGGVYPRIEDVNTNDLLASVGIGIRYRLSDQSKLNYRVDYAIGEDEDAIYFSVGEAF